MEVENKGSEGLGIWDLALFIASPFSISIYNMHIVSRKGQIWGTFISDYALTQGVVWMSEL